MGEYAPFISGALGFLGVIIGSLWTRYSGIQQQKTANTFLLHNEFCGKEMNNVRYLAGDFIKKYAKDNLNDLYKWLSPQEATPLWTLMDFYKRLWISLKHHQLQDSLVPELFGSIFIWWHVNCFEKRLKGVDWDESEYLAELRQWFEEHATKNDYLRWKGRAERHDLERSASNPTQLPTTS